MRDYTVVCNAKDRENWLRHRQEGIGSSDIAVVMGLTKWKSPLRLWAEKRGEVEADNLDLIEAIYWGNILEPIVAQEFTARTGRKIRRWNKLLRSKKYPWATCTPDYMTWDNGELCLLEIKTGSAYTSSQWDEGTPEYYSYQVQHQLLVTGLKKAFSAVLLGGQKFAYDEIQRNEQMIRKIIYSGTRFWRKVMNGEEPDANAQDGRFLNQRYPERDEDEIELKPELLEFANAYLVAHDKVKLWEELKNSNKNQLIQKMQNHKYGYFYDGTRVTAKPFRVKLNEEEKTNGSKNR